MDTLALEGMQFYSNHGYYAHEKEIGGRFVVDVYLKTDMQQAGRSDDLTDAINYEKVYELVASIMDEPKNLIEHVGYQLLEALAVRFPAVQHVKIRISKLQPPLKGNVERTFFELEKNLQNIDSSGGYWEQRAKY